VIFPTAPAISHLLFVDDTLFFFKAKEDQDDMIKKLDKRYALGTGQLINHSKSSILSGSVCSKEVQDAIEEILQVEQAGFETKYLGFPVSEGRMSKVKLHSLQAKMIKRLIDWGEKYLSLGGKEILIKAVAQDLPTYVMIVFKMPLSVCDDLTKMVRSY
jgi:hypothetical protein